MIRYRVVNSPGERYAYRVEVRSFIFWHLIDAYDNLEEAEENIKDRLRCDKEASIPKTVIREYGMEFIDKPAPKPLKEVYG